MTNFSDIPKPSLPTKETMIPKRSQKEVDILVKKMVKIASEGKKIRDEYDVKTRINGFNCQL